MKLIPTLTESEIEKVRAPLNDAYTLPKAAYTDADVYEQELEQVLRKSWIPVGRVDQVPEPGNYLAFDLLGQPAIIVHGNDGEIRVMSSVLLASRRTGRRRVWPKECLHLSLSCLEL